MGSYLISQSTLPACNLVSNAVWLHHLDLNEMPGEKVRWELHKDIVCCFWQILEAEPYKTPTLGPLTFHLTNHPNNMSKICSTTKEKLINDILQWTLTYGHTNIGQPAKTYIHQLCGNTGCCLEYLLIGTNDERESRESVVLVCYDDEWLSGLFQLSLVIPHLIWTLLEVYSKLYFIYMLLGKINNWWTAYKTIINSWF